MHQGKRLPVAGWNSFRGKGASSEERGNSLQDVGGDQGNAASSREQNPGLREERNSRFVFTILEGID